MPKFVNHLRRQQMKPSTKRRIVDITINNILIGGIITAEPAWWAWPAVAALAMWNFYDGVTRCDLWRDN